MSGTGDAPQGGPPGVFATLASEAQADAINAMSRVLEAVLELVGSADGAAVELVGTKDWLVTVAGVGLMAPQLGYLVSPRHSLSAAALRANTTVSCEDAVTDPRADHDVAAAIGTRSLICLPLRRSSSAIGVLAVASSTPGAFSQADNELLELVADLVSTLVGAAAETVGSVQALLAKASLVPAGAGATGVMASNRLADFAANALRPGLLDQAMARRRIAEVVSGRKITTVCQPIVELVSGRVVAVEALSRFPEDIARPTEKWFTEAAAVGLADELELAAVEAALKVLPVLPGSVSLSVNVGPSLLVAQALDDKLAEVPPGRVVIELTEHTAVHDYQHLASRLSHLRGKGLRLAIDDTGAGISSLAHILRLSPNIIKLDRSLIAGVDADPARRVLARALVDFGAEIGASLVAEGIETASELATLQAMGVTLGQGYYLGRPAAIDVLLGSWTSAGATEADDVVLPPSAR
ncbi:MAG: sensor domain-containing phosphodiesterase [Acidimicrobiales bacterium]